MILRASRGERGASDGRMLHNIALAALASAAGRQYDTLTTTCRNSKPLTGSLSVASVADCLTRCDSYAGCTAVDTDGATCFLKSYCEGDVGACSGWCGHRLKSGPPTPPMNETLRAAAARRGVFVGAAANAGHLAGDAAYTATLGAQYSLATAENACAHGCSQRRLQSFRGGNGDLPVVYLSNHRAVLK